MNRSLPKRLILIIACAAPLPLCACLGSASRSAVEGPRQTVRVPVQPASSGGAQQASTLILGVQ